MEPWQTWIEPLNALAGRTLVDVRTADTPIQPVPGSKGAPEISDGRSLIFLYTVSNSGII